MANQSHLCYWLASHPEKSIKGHVLQLTETTNMLEKTRQEVEMAQVKLTSMQQSLAEKEAHLTNLSAERRRQLEEVLEMK